MSVLIFENAESQYIDDNGKTRMINFDIDGDKLSLMTSPIPPLDLPSDRTISEISIKSALEFIRERGLAITFQDGNEEDGIQGLWVEMQEENPGIYYGYIPIKIAKSLSDVEFADPTKNDPLRTDNISSELHTFRKNRKIADFLKHYVLYTYSLDPENFGEDSFVVKKGHVYDIEKLNKRLFKENNRVMYDKNGKLIATSDAIVRNLLSYLKVRIATDKPGVLNMRNLTTIPDYYQSISDFRPAPNQLIFTSANGVIRWKREMKRNKTANTISDNLMAESTEPYFYRAPKIEKGLLMVVQNVQDGLLENAAYVSYKWLKDRVNIGFAAENQGTKEISYSIYTKAGKFKDHKKGTKEFAPVILYEDGTYGALLFLIQE